MKFFLMRVFFNNAVLTLSPGKAISGLDVIVIFDRACAALTLPTSVFSEVNGIKACIGKRTLLHHQNISIFRLN